jgi:hypothetical protein
MTLKKKKLKKLIRELKSIKEDGAPVNCVGGGAIASVGISSPSGDKSFGEPGVKLGIKKKKSPVMGSIERRNPPNIRG